MEKTPRASHQQFRWGHSKDLIEGHDVIQKNKTLTFKSLSSKLYLHGSTGSWLSSITKSCWRCSTHSTSISNWTQPTTILHWRSTISLKSLKKRNKKRNGVQTMKSLSYFCISTRFTHRDRFSSKPNCRWRMRRKTLKAQVRHCCHSFIMYVSFHQHLHEVKL